MASGIILKLMHPRRRNIVIRGLLVIIGVLFLIVWFKYRDNTQDYNYIRRPADEDLINIIDNPIATQNNQQNEIADAIVQREIFVPTEKTGADEVPLKYHTKFIATSKSSSKIESRTTEEQLLDEEIEAMNRKIVQGLGENGEAVTLTGAEAVLGETLMKKEAFNIIVSDKISYTRSIPDNRNNQCKTIKYPQDLPNASVIIIFNNEAWSPLLRTIYSVINRTPAHLLHEIILLDDFSDRVEMKAQLARYVKLNFDDKLKIIRAPKRLGLIRARVAGAQAAKGKVMVFLDSHCEVNDGWLEPLLSRIHENRKVALVPIIEVIDDKTLKYYAGSEDFFQVGSFTWSGHFTWINIPDRELERRGSSIAPTRSATMAGGLFAMDRDYFWEIGGYDEGMDVWGGENLELSFRVWMCGGSLETIPCSRVGHIFRSFHPYTFPGNKDTHGINTVRMAEVWMDDYKRLFYLYRPDLKTIEYGDVTDRKQLRQKLQCQDFKWFLKYISPEKFILDDDSIAYGRVSNKKRKLCLDMLQQNEKISYELGLYPCHPTEMMSQVKNARGLCLDYLQKDEDNDYELGLYFCHARLENSQFFSFSKHRQLRRESVCATVSKYKIQAEKVMMKSCTEVDLQEWEFSQNGSIVHLASKRCLDPIDSNSMMTVWVTACDGSDRQKWTINHDFAPDSS